MKVIKRIPQMVLGAALIFAGFGHLGPNRLEFQAQVPNLFKDYADQVVLLSGVVEIPSNYWISYSCIFCSNLLGQHFPVC